MDIGDLQLLWLYVMHNNLCRGRIIILTVILSWLRFKLQLHISTIKTSSWYCRVCNLFGHRSLFFNKRLLKQFHSKFYVSKIEIAIKYVHNKDKFMMLLGLQSLQSSFAVFQEEIAWAISFDILCLQGHVVTESRAEEKSTKLNQCWFNVSPSSQKLV